MACRDNSDDDDDDVVCESSGSGRPCGACKFLRRKCVSDCIFAPYFSSCQQAASSATFAAIHKVFGASNVSKLLLHLPITHRSQAVLTIAYQAQARIHDPVYGCVAHLFALQQQVAYLQAQVMQAKAQLEQINMIESGGNMEIQRTNKFNNILPTTGIIPINNYDQTQIIMNHEVSPQSSMESAANNNNIELANLFNINLQESQISRSSINYSEPQFQQFDTNRQAFCHTTDVGELQALAFTMMRN